jgi:hypothetical protein
VCNTDFNFHDISLTYAKDIYECADRCAVWSSDGSKIPCIGATLDYGFYGPNGIAGGSQCWLKYNMSEGEPHPSLEGNAQSVDSVRLLDQPAVNVHTIKALDLLIYRKQR